MQRIVQACLPAEEQGQVALPGWMRAYASAAWQDRFFAEQNFTPLQQVSRNPGSRTTCAWLSGQAEDSGPKVWLCCSLHDQVPNYAYIGGMLDMC